MKNIKNSHFLAEVDPSWTLFLDRDGVINTREPDIYITCWEEFHFLPGVLEALHFLGPLFYKIVIVTNQQGVGKGIMSHAALENIHNNLFLSIQNANAEIDAIYYCTDLDGMESHRRKPSPGMAYEAQKDFPFIDFAKSIMVGDTLSDLKFGKNLGMKNVFVHYPQLIKHVPVEADLSVKDLKEFYLLLSSY